MNGFPFVLDWEGGEMVTIDSLGERNELLPVSLLKVLQSKGHKSILLVPFEISKWSPRLLESAVNMAETKGAELVLLCVRLPSKSLCDALEDEHHFSALRSLQAQLHHRAIPISIETVVGPVAQSVLDYAEQNDADMILLTRQQAGPGIGGKETLRA
jgi:nucleotide-binding universal stress UspA family protein